MSQSISLCLKEKKNNNSPFIYLSLLKLKENDVFIYIKNVFCFKEGGFPHFVLPARYTFFYSFSFTTIDSTEAKVI